jgi:hypothetical protein
MKIAQIQSIARQLLEARGAKAIADAAQAARRLASRGSRDKAQTWRRIEAALVLMRGPRQS